MDTDSFTIKKKSLDVYKDKAINVEERHDTSNYNERRRNHPLEIGKNRKVIH